MSDLHHQFVKYPVGNIPKGSWCDCCKRFNSRKITLTAVAVKDGRVLLVHRKRDPEKDKWCMPGGYLDWEETTEQGVRRELEEETGLVAGEVELLGVFSDPSRDADGRQNVDCVYLATQLTGELRPQQLEVRQLKWFDLDDLPEKMAFDHRQILQAARQKWPQLG